jgi:hypothetical protein
VICYPCLERPGQQPNGDGYRSTHYLCDSTYAARCPARKLLYLPAMSKPSKRRTRTRGTVDRSATVDVVSQLECSLRNPHAAAIGAVIGGLVPWFGRTLAHEEIPSAWSSNHGLALAMIGVVLGCACFSALSVYKFGKAAFGDSRKAIGFVLALEGVMLISHGVTSTVALAVLIAINAIANGSVIALSRDATRRQREADARRAATRASNRTHRTGAPARRAPATAPAPQAPQARPAGTPGLVKVPSWWSPVNDDVIDAEIVSEESYS